ncbi:MAG: hypothetical protein M3Q23_17925 [Actinomycetota bacterium]|nr:hypothetical protein [Actinomycetota bacterium]
MAIVIGILALVAGAACGAKAGPSQEGSSVAGTPSEPPAADFGDLETVDWLEPIEQGIAISSIDQANGVVSFPIEVPQGLGNPHIFMTDPTSAPRQERLVAFVLDVAPYGTVDVVEGPPDASADRWASFVANTVAASQFPGGSGSALSVLLGDGSLALVTVAEEGVPADISWLRAAGQTEVTLKGPSLTADQVQRLANSAFSP